MKTLFIEARKSGKINFSALKLPGRTISLASTIQYLDFVPKISNYLKKKGKKIIIKKGAKFPAHIIGCNPSAFDKKADALLLLADGKFHALNNAILLDKEIYIFNLDSLEKITKQEISRIKAKIKAKQSKFLLYNDIGIIISTKPGQKYPHAFRLKEKLEKKGKKAYVFQADTLNPQELENFPIKIWINTACPGIGIEQENIINLRDIQDFL